MKQIIKVVNRYITKIQREAKQNQPSTTFQSTRRKQ